VNAELAREIVELMEKTVRKSGLRKPAKMNLFIKLVGITGIVLVSGLATLNTVYGRWNAIPDLQQTAKQFMSHDTEQKVQMTEIRMTLKSIENVSADQQRQLTDISKDIKTLMLRPRAPIN